LESAVEEGIQKAKRKRALIESENAKNAKKAKSIDSWTGVELEESSSSDSSAPSSPLSDMSIPDFTDDEDDVKADSNGNGTGASTSRSTTTTAPQPASSQNQSIPEEDSSKNGKKTEDVQKPPAEKPVIDYPRIDLSKVASVQELEVFGLDHLKAELRARNMKCGGTLAERTKRLWNSKDKGGSSD